jgi:hypothetical protein
MFEDKCSTTNENIIHMLNYYDLPWMKYIGTKQQVHFIIYLCLFAKYNNNSTIYNILKSQHNLLLYIKRYITNNVFFNYNKNYDNKNNATNNKTNKTTKTNGINDTHDTNNIKTGKIRLIENCNEHYHCINFKLFTELNDITLCETYLNYKKILNNSDLYNTTNISHNVLNEYITLFNLFLNKFVKKYKCIISNNSYNKINFDCIKYDKIGFYKYEDEILNDVF